MVQELRRSNRYGTRATRARIRASEAFHCNEDILLKEAILSGTIEESEEVDEGENMGRAEHEENMTSARTTCSISGVDGLPSTIPKRKYRMNKRGRKEK